VDSTLNSRSYIGLRRFLRNSKQRLRTDCCSGVSSLVGDFGVGDFGENASPNWGMTNPKETKELNEFHDQIRESYLENYKFDPEAEDREYREFLLAQMNSGGF